MSGKEILEEFDRQLETLLQRGYAKAANMTREEFILLFEPLKERLYSIIIPKPDIEKGHLPFVLVVKNELVSTEKAMSLVEKKGKEGITKLFPHTPEDFSVIDGVEIPGSTVYILIDIDRGQDNINTPPDEAMQIILKANRSPLTIDEGVAIVTQYPDFLMKNNCFSLLASRHSGDKRVPAIWINAAKHPNLGWCWDGNPHTWLGSASCKLRLSCIETI